MARTIVPEFSKFRQEEALIGKLVIGYGELEFALARAVQWIIDDEDIALRWLYKSRGESQRISTAEALTFHVLRGHSLETMFAQAVDAMKHCLERCEVCWNRFGIPKSAVI